MSAPTPEAVARETLSLLRAKADPVRARGAEAYFKETIRAFGVRAADIRQIATGISRRVRREWTVDDAVRLCELLLPRPELEAKGVAILVLHRFRRTYPPELFDTIHGWLAADRLANWASVDALCPEVVGALVAARPPFLRRLETWARSDNRWVRRASLVSLLKLTRRPEYRDAIYAMARRHFGSDDDLVQKAAGWLLREVGKSDMAALEAFLRAHGPRIPRTTLRYAIERFPPSRRRELLESTRG
ncbi:MAG: DNA alkylation repair protein [Vicinamibacteria bacterium]